MAVLASFSDETMAEMGKNPEPEPVIKDACSVEVLQLLIDAGEKLRMQTPNYAEEYIGLLQRRRSNAANLPI